MMTIRRMPHIFFITLGFLAIMGAGQTYGQGIWESKASMPTARQNAATGVINGKLYVVGGYNGSSSLTTLEVYDPATNTWEAKAPMPTARNSMSGEVIGGKLYVVGGVAQNNLNILEVYDPVTNTWASEAPMINPRSNLGTAVFDGKLYAAGGCAGYCAPVTNVLEVYDPASDTWTYKASMLTGRGFTDVAVVNGLFYAMGGCCGWTGPESNVMANTVEVYDPTSNTWAARAQHLVGGNDTTGNINDKIYVAKPTATEVYDPLGDTWSSLSPMPTPRIDAFGGVINGRLYVVGGSIANQAAATLEVYTPDSDLDAVGDVDDAFPNDPAASKDSDGDGYPDEWNANATAQMIAASNLQLDSFPFDPAASSDSDTDGYPDEWNANATVQLISGSNLLLDSFPNDPAASMDSDGDGHPNGWNTNATAQVISASNLLVDSFPNDPAASKDTDGDGYPDEWNANAPAQVIAASNLLLDEFPNDPAASKDTDGDGYPDEWNTNATAQMIADSTLVIDSLPQDPNRWTNLPSQPFLISPASPGSLDTLPPILKTGPFSDPNNDSHLMTRWQVSTSGTELEFENDLVFDLETDTSLTSLQIPELILQSNQTYFWRVRFTNQNQYESAWSSVFSFSTPEATNDSDGNGIEEEFEIAASIDLDRDGVADNLQSDIKTVKTSIGNAQAGIKVSTGVIAIEQVKPLNPIGLADEGKPVNLPFGLFSFRLRVTPGAEAEVDVHFSQALSPQMKWYKYDPSGGWYDFSSNAVFNATRTSVTLKLRDGGAGDADGVVNGIIVDPSGPGSDTFSETGSGGGGGGGGCFIKTLSSAF